MGTNSPDRGESSPFQETEAIATKLLLAATTQKK